MTKERAREHARSIVEAATPGSAQGHLGGAACEAALDQAVSLERIADALERIAAHLTADDVDRCTATYQQGNSQPRRCEYAIDHAIPHRSGSILWPTR